MKAIKTPAAIEPTSDFVKLVVLCNVVSRGNIYGRKGETIEAPVHVATELLARKPAIVKKA